MSALLVLDEIVGRRLAIQLDAMGYRVRRGVEGLTCFFFKPPKDKINRYIAVRRM